ncbi:MAG: AAA family ATPase [Planctomycetes bacterium]|nr:AAA family ATPase [Planctomycetota bacterium]
MITGITIVNFKGIREPVKLDFRPITLLFGANSAGKSTILHALHYAREVFERHNLDADQTIAGGKYIDLGGFKNLLHRTDNDQADHPTTLKLRIDLELTARDLEIDGSEIDSLIQETINDFQRFGSIDEFDPDYARELADIPFHTLTHPFKTAAVELEICWSDLDEVPYVLANTIYFDGEPFLQLVGNEHRRGASLRFEFESVEKLDQSKVKKISTFHHKSLKRLSDLTKEQWFLRSPNEEWSSDNRTLLEVLYESSGEMLSFYPKQIELDNIEDALPQSGKNLFFSPAMISPTGDRYDDAKHAFEINLSQKVFDVLSHYILEPCRLIRDQLKDFRYLGPLRDTPSRLFEPPRFPDPSRWASGLGAWDTLHRGTDQFVVGVGDWLGGTDKLNAGCRIERRSYIELDYADPMIRALISRRAFDDLDEYGGVNLSGFPTTSRIVIVPSNGDIELRPHDVGIGISQVVPVIVTALDGSERLLAIEQPELHIHPRLQAEIADLFIEAIHSNKHRFIIETHSEHLILRLLRRIRETEVNKAPANRTLRTDDLAIYYLKQEEGTSRALEIEVDVKGEFIQPWPDDFFEIDFFERFPDAR